MVQKEEAVAVEAVREVKVEVKRSDMSREMEEHAKEAVKEAFENNGLEKDIATAVKKTLDDKYPKTTWQVICGKHFGVSVSHATKNLLFASYGQHSVLLFKSD